MIIKKKKVCDICESTVGINNPYITLTARNLIQASGGQMHEFQRLHICGDCFEKLAEQIKDKINDEVAE